MLKHAFERPGNKQSAPPEPDPHAPPAASGPPQRKHRSLAWRLFKAGVAISLVTIVGWEPVRAVLAPTSVEAVVNARLITLKSPIAGEIWTDRLPLPGDMVDRGSLLLRVSNQRTDRTRLDDMRHELSRVRSETAILARKKQWAETRHAELHRQTEAFADARRRELEARRKELQSELAVASARNFEAQAALTRAEYLAPRNGISATDLERIRRDASIAAALVEVAGHRITSTTVELDALKTGSFVGDSYNDRPSTAQMADDLALKINDMRTELEMLEKREKNLATGLSEEETRYAYLSRFEMTVPIRGRIWEIMTAPGEQVAPGQDLVKLLDCSGALVTASVSESVYNHLRVGTPARFRLRDDGRVYAGQVVNLTGYSGAGTNLAIEPSSLVKEPYRVMVAVPELQAGPSCNIGRTGRVYFGEPQRGFSLSALWR
jgi:multidrug resistance efflux pump